MLLYIGRYKPKVLEGARLEELALFLLVFLASPEYVRNPYLRSKLAEVSTSLSNHKAASVTCLAANELRRRAGALVSWSWCLT